MLSVPRPETVQGCHPYHGSAVASRDPQMSHRAVRGAHGIKAQHTQHFNC